MRRSTQVPTAWPDVNDRVRLGLDLPSEEDEAELVTRVEDVRDGLLVVAAPTFAGDLHAAHPGLRVTVSWSTERGYCHQDFTLLAVVRSGVPCWELDPAGELSFAQRRRFVRVPVTGVARLQTVPDPDHLTGPSGGAAGGLQDGAPGAEDRGEDVPDDLTAHLVDLSEGSACVRSLPLPWLAAGRLVTLCFDVDGIPVVQRAEVLRRRPAPGPAPLDPAQQAVDTVLVFVEPVPEADRVRRYVMRIQIENRRRGER